MLPTWAPPRSVCCQDDEYDCGQLEHVPFIYLGFAPVWLTASVLWAKNNMRHRQHVRELHRRLSLLPLLGLAQASLSVVFYSLCPWHKFETGLLFVLSMLWVLATIFKEPVVIACFVLVAKGWEYSYVTEPAPMCDGGFNPV